ncbi:hypothetical protein AXG93_1543s1510 [Marchantia polymorpha subsp. ruderalis]|uniref:C2 domain-containing protein n=1 Tax=Marchantia polymorpha subsp. ruderalis TaxID=1480154 RepID=A0A176VXJ1_MARPO|nr:hypothetical protein AXG93_1543s1510 [Marchantia polymorpha subsp. ruderalis]
MRAGELIIHLKGAKGIKGHEFMGLGRANMYAAFCIGGENRKSNVVRNGGSNPQWNEQVSFKIAEYVNFAMYDWLHISLYQPHDIKRNSPRGTVKINVEKLLEAMITITRISSTKHVRNELVEHSKGSSPSLDRDAHEMRWTTVLVICKNNLERLSTNVKH